MLHLEFTRRNKNNNKKKSHHFLYFSFPFKTKINTILETIHAILSVAEVGHLAISVLEL